ncbi:DUF3310 domain-containing protein [Corynebacterium mastitidis]|uniref:DUF3310 domain-containing protein n=1 Tax=Corynebacterium mastitidis TaxID=161890 RepID=UPI000371BD89|nr:DUF3310 domain-containing protein [Corynebacterium mastitidis]
MTTYDPINPDYYRVGGIETLALARELTFCAGNAVKYLVRSCRIDAVHKADRIQDLRKARRFIEEEISRLEETQADSDTAWRQQQVAEEAIEEGYAQTAENLTPLVDDYGNLYWGHLGCASQPEVADRGNVLIEQCVYQRAEYPDAPIALQILTDDGTPYKGIIGLGVDDATRIGRILLEAARLAENQEAA